MALYRLVDYSIIHRETRRFTLFSTHTLHLGIIIKIKEGIKKVLKMHHI